MSSVDYRYTVAELHNSDILTYLFISEGKEAVLKIIQYGYLQHFNDKTVYNLGFGDLDIETREIDDESITDNGDVYKIFNTVLSTIPLFYEKYPWHIILVQGSDGREEFEANCRSICIRHCGPICRNFNRRMKIYCNYVSRKIGILKPDYQFLGGIRNNNDWFDFKDFKPGKLYDAIMVIKKNT